MTSRDSVPARVTPLVGRHAELNELELLLATERVVTLTGSGGCGKTRLAVELAQRVAEDFPGGVVWVDTAAHSESEDVACGLASALDAIETAGETALGCAVRAIRSRERVLLVLDNVEHMLLAVAEVVATVSRSAEHVNVVCTSREPVGVPGEVVWRVPSLRTPALDPSDTVTARSIHEFEAVQLFVDRAWRARRGFALTDANAGAIAQICARLDGVPLAIELAAARVRTMPPERVAALLDDRFRLLAGGPRTQLARHQTLHASVAWSESLLDDTERIVFRRLGVFSSGFTLDAAEAVIGSFDDVDRYEIAELVGRLVDKSLVQLDELHDRYTLLDTIRSYALQRLLDTDETARARDAHAEWCAAWLTVIDTASEGTDVNSWWNSRLAIVRHVDREWPNCASALDWAEPGGSLSLRLVAGLGDYWALRQRASDSRRYGMLPVLLGDHDSPEWMQAILSLQTVRTNAADLDFNTLRDEAIRLATERGDRRSLLRLELARHILMVMLVGPRDDLVAALDEVAAEADELGEWFTAWNARQSPAVIMGAAGRPAEAEARVVGLTSARALLIRAVCAQMRGEMATSDELAAQAATMVDVHFGAAMDRILIAFRAAGMALVTGDPAATTALGLGEFQADSVPRMLFSAYSMAHGVDRLLNGRLQDARKTFDAAPPDLFTSWRGVCLLAQIELALGDRDAARATAMRLGEVAASVAAPLYDATSKLVLAECERDDDVNLALDLAHQALATAADAELWTAAVDALEGIGSMLLDVGRDRDAARLLGAAQAGRGTMPYHYRFAHRATYVAAAQESVIGTDAWIEGIGLTLPGAVEVAQRMRGERVRPIGGWESLTPTEQRVVEQVAAGLTNPQIAAELLMSRATVKTHLVHVYAKLGFSNRAELAAAVARRSAS